jgi:hypothetical protein
MNCAWRIFRGFLIVWGLITFVSFLVLAGVVFYQTGPGNRPSNKTASKHDVRFVLNWCHLGEDRIVEVVHSYASERSSPGITWTVMRSGSRTLTQVSWFLTRTEPAAGIEATNSNWIGPAPVVA